MKTRKELEQRIKELEELVYFDELTKIKNKRALNEEFKREINRYLRKNIVSHILVIDLNGFKEINDTKGHKAGDEILKNTASLIKSTIRDQDDVYRQGGDEFVVILRDLTGDRSIEVMNRIRKTLSENQIKASIGKARILGEASLEEADMNMYSDKKLSGASNI